MRTRRSDADLEQIEDADVHGFLCGLRCVGFRVWRYCTSAAFWLIEQKRHANGTATSDRSHGDTATDFAVVVEAFIENAQAASDRLRGAVRAVDA
jgi:hypothetical protein